MHDSEPQAIKLSMATAKEYNLVEGDLTTARQGGSEIKLPLVIDDRVSYGVVMIASACEETRGFGQVSQSIELVQEGL